ncbi:MAG TPA: hypothetical protein PLN21_00035 [Gemmatales bacterium]|nr:hypothetical protein [Gemmatales bacterium]
MARMYGISAIVFMVLLTGCGKSKQTNEKKNLIVGLWSGQYQNLPAIEGKASPSMTFNFEFTSDGQFRMGKRKVWVDGTYQFQDDKTFTVAIKGMPAGPYQIKELSSDRLVYEWQIDEKRNQRTELTRQK